MTGEIEDIASRVSDVEDFEDDPDPEDEPHHGAAPTPSHAVASATVAASP
jgi:hypothetical protein